MSIALSKIRSGVALASEIVKAADQANDTNGRTARSELRGILDTEGYGPSHVIRRGTLSLRAYAYRIAGSRDPGEQAIDTAAGRALRAIERAAGRDGVKAELSRDEFLTLSPTAKRLAAFSARYGDRSLDSLFF